MKFKEFLTQKINKDSLKKDSVKRAIKITVCCAFILSLIFQLVCCSFGPLVIHAYSNPLAEEVQLVYVDELPTTDIDDNAIYVVTNTVVDDSIVGTWVFNDVITVLDGVYSIEFTCDYPVSGQQMFKIGISPSTITSTQQLQYFRISPNSGNEQAITAYQYKTNNVVVNEWTTGCQVINIIGGLDIANVSLITWLNANAVKQGGSGSGSSVTTYYVYYNNTWFDTDNISTAVSFINYRVTNPSSVNTLPELLDSYTGSFDSLVDMLNSDNYNEYESYLSEVEDSAYNRGVSTSFGENLLGSSYNAPLNGLNQFVLFETSGGLEVTLGGLFTALIALIVFVVLLRLFAGG